MDNLLTGFGVLDQDKADVADLCYRSGSGIGAYCVPSTHVKEQTSLPSTRWVPPPKANHSILDQTSLLPTRWVPSPKPHNYIKKVNIPCLPNIIGSTDQFRLWIALNGDQILDMVVANEGWHNVLMPRSAVQYPRADGWTISLLDLELLTKTRPMLQTSAIGVGRASVHLVDGRDGCPFTWVDGTQDAPMPDPLL